MFKRSLLLLSVSLLVCSFRMTCDAQTIKTPLEFNNYIAAITDSISQKAEVWSNKLTGIVTDTKDYSELVIPRKALISYIDKETVKLKNIKDISGSEKLKQSMISSLAFEKKTILEGFIPFEKLDSNSTGEQLQKAIDNVTGLAAKEEPELKKLNEAQKEYATKNNFTINEEKKESQ